MQHAGDAKKAERSGGGAASLLTCPYRMRAAPDCGRGVSAAASEGSLLIILYPKRAVFSLSPEDTSADRLEPVEGVSIYILE